MAIESIKILDNENKDLHVIFEHSPITRTSMTVSTCSNETLEVALWNTNNQRIDSKFIPIDEFIQVADKLKEWKENR